MSTELKTDLKTSAGFLPKATAIFIVSISAILFWALLVASLVYFPARTVSTQLNDLGLYGDFIGGTLGTLVAMATLGVTIYLAITLHKLERENASSAINAQKKIAMMQLKFQEFAVFKTNCDKAIELMSNPDDHPDKIKEGYILFLNSAERFVTLFPDLEVKIGFVSPANHFRLVKDMSKELQDTRNLVRFDLDVNKLIKDLCYNFKKGNIEYMAIVKKLSDWVLE